LNSSWGYTLVSRRWLIIDPFKDHSRWMKQGKVVGLRRGMYTLSETYHLPAVREDVSPFLERPQDAALLTRENLEGLL
jgi:hypothetical protein